MRFRCINMRYSIEPRDRIYVKGYGFLSFVKNMGKDLAINKVKNVLIALKKGQYNNIMLEYQKIANLLDKGSNQPSKFRTKDCVEINDQSRETYSVNRQIYFKTSMLRSSLCDYSDAYILVKGNISVNNTAAADADGNNTCKNVIFKNCAPFTDCIRKIN